MQLLMVLPVRNQHKITIAVTVTVVVWEEVSSDGPLCSRYMLCVLLLCTCFIAKYCCNLEQQIFCTEYSICCWAMQTIFTLDWKLIAKLYIPTLFYSLNLTFFLFRRRNRPFRRRETEALHREEAICWRRLRRTSCPCRLCSGLWGEWMLFVWFVWLHGCCVRCCLVCDLLNWNVVRQTL